MQAIAQTNPTISRAMATVTTLAVLPSTTLAGAGNRLVPDGFFG